MPERAERAVTPRATFLTDWLPCAEKSPVFWFFVTNVACLGILIFPFLFFCMPELAIAFDLSR